VNDGRADFVPVHLSEIPALVRSGDLAVDVALVHVAPPDEHGFWSYGAARGGSKAEARLTRIRCVTEVAPRHSLRTARA